MPSAYYHVAVSEWIRRQRSMAQFVEHDDGRYERIVTLDVCTQEDNGRVVLRLDIDEVGEGLGGWSTHVDWYDMSEFDDSREDAVALAMALGFRARLASTRNGWCYWDGEQLPAEFNPEDIPIGD